MCAVALGASLVAPGGAVVGGCGDDKKGDSPTASKGGESGTAGDGKSKGKAKAKKPSERPNMATFRPLLAESARAELESGGLLVDFGTADQHKYTRGGWKTGWGASKNEKGVTFAPADARKSDVNVVIPDGPGVKEIIIRGRTAVAGQVLTVYVDGERIGDGRFESAWSTIRIPAKGLDAGLHGIDYVFSKSGATRADVDWMLLANEAGVTEPAVMPRVLPIKFDKSPMRSLIAPSARSYSFFLQPPADARLVFDFGSDKGATFKVMAQANGEEAKELWSATAKNEWQEAVVDLSAYSGKATRLSLVTEGDAGVAGWGEPEIMLGKAPTPAMKEGKGPTNVIVIVMDTNRADSFKAFNPKSRVKTPGFDAFAAKSLVFESAYNQENWTKPSVATTLSGTYPDTHQTKKDGSALPTEVELISQRLKKEGFQTAGFVANGYISEKFGFEKGWDTFKNYIRLSKPSQAEHVYGDSLAWLKENKDEKYFLYIQTIDPHVPYRHKGEATAQYYAGDYHGALGNSISAEKQIAAGKKAPSAADLKWLKAMYYGETSHHDTEMGKFFAELEGMGVMNDTMIIITNDHGEELGEHGKFGHGHSLYEELLRAPMVIHYPSLIDAGVLSNEVTENVDIAPTVVDALGLSPMKSADGLSLLPLMKGEPVQRPYYAMSEFMESRRAIRVGGWKMIWAGGTTVNVFHSEQDRAETKDLAKKALIARRLLEVHAGEAQAAYDKKQRMQDITTKRQFTAGEADIDPETRKQLDALGYFGE
ncbi:MAG: sulfatase [Myxococcales bacterium]|nr:sulfatase [Myxococcales bacterium]